MNDEAYTKAIGANIKAARKRVGLSQLELAYRLDMDKSNLIRLEKGRTNPTVKTLRKIALSLEVDIRQFFDIKSIEQY